MKRLAKQNINTPQHLDWVWSQPAMHRYDAERLNSMLGPIRPGQKIVELGAGRFSASEYAINELHLIENAGCEFWAVDYSQIAVEMTKSACPRLNYIQGDLFNKFSDATFDGVMCGEVIEHLEEPELLVKEMARLVKLGGWATLTTVNEECDDAIQHGEYPEHVWAFTQEDLKAMFEKYFSSVFVGFVGNYRFVEAYK